MVDDFLNSDAFRGAYAGAKLTLEQLGIEMSDAILISVASNVLKGFVTMGGLEPDCLEPDCLETLRAIVIVDEPDTRNSGSASGDLFRDIVQNHGRQMAKADGGRQ